MNNVILEFLKELVRFRQREFAEMQKAKCSKQMLQNYTARTDQLIKCIATTENANTLICSNKQLSIEQAIEYAEEQEQLQLVEWLSELVALRKQHKLAVEMCADYENYKKRSERTTASAIENANKDIILKLIGVVDDFDRAQKSLEEYESNPVAEGIKLVYKHLLKVLDDEDCKKIECKPGDKFDVNIHHAIATAPMAASQQKDTVECIKRDGWMLHEKLLRPVQVVVAT